MPDLLRTQLFELTTAGHIGGPRSALNDRAIDDESPMLLSATRTLTVDAVLHFSFRVRSFDQVWYEGGIWTDCTVQARLRDGITFGFGNANWTYFGSVEQFGRVLVNHVVGGGGGAADFEYWNGAWVAIDGLIDGTADFTGNGEITFPRPGDWAQTNVNGVGPLWWIRARCPNVTSLEMMVPSPDVDRDFVVRRVWLEMLRSFAGVPFGYSPVTSLPISIAVEIGYGVANLTAAAAVITWSEDADGRAHAEIIFDEDHLIDEIRFELNGPAAGVPTQYTFAVTDLRIWGHDYGRTASENDDAIACDSNEDGIPEPSARFVGATIHGGLQTASGAVKPGDADNLALAGVVTVTGTHAPIGAYSFVAANSIDGDVDTAWIAEINVAAMNGTNILWRCDLGAQYTLGGIWWMPHAITSKFGGGVNPYIFFRDNIPGIRVLARVQVSANGVLWKTVRDECAEQGGGAAGSQCVDGFSNRVIFPRGLTCRYIRIYLCAVVTDVYLLREQGGTPGYGTPYSPVLTWVGLAEVGIFGRDIFEVGYIGAGAVNPERAVLESTPAQAELTLPAMRFQGKGASLLLCNADRYYSTTLPAGLFFERGFGWWVTIRQYREGPEENVSRSVFVGIVEDIVETTVDNVPAVELVLQDARAYLVRQPLRANGIMAWEEEPRRFGYQFIDEHDPGTNYDDEQTAYSWNYPMLMPSIRWRHHDGYEMPRNYDSDLTHRTLWYVYVNPLIAIPETWEILFTVAEGHFVCKSSHSGIEKEGNIDQLFYSGTEFCDSAIVIRPEYWRRLSTDPPDEGSRVTFRTTRAFGHCPGFPRGGGWMEDYNPYSNWTTLGLPDDVTAGASLPGSLAMSVLTGAGMIEDALDLSDEWDDIDTASFVAIDTLFASSWLNGAFLQPCSIAKALEMIARLFAGSIHPDQHGRMTAVYMYPTSETPGSAPRLYPLFPPTKQFMYAIEKVTVRYAYEWREERDDFTESITMPWGTGLGEATEEEAGLIDLPMVAQHGRATAAGVCGKTYGFRRRTFALIDMEVAGHLDDVEIGDEFTLVSHDPPLYGPDFSTGEYPLEALVQIVAKSVRYVAYDGGVTTVPKVSLTAVLWSLGQFYCLDRNMLPVGDADSKPIL